MNVRLVPARGGTAGRVSNPTPKVYTGGLSDGEESGDSGMTSGGENSGGVALKDTRLPTVLIGGLYSFVLRATASEYGISNQRSGIC